MRERGGEIIIFWIRKERKLLIFLGLFFVSLSIASGLHAGVYPDTPERLWPGGKVPFEYTVDVNGFQQCCVESAMAVWEDVSNVRFIPRTVEDDYLLIQRGTVGPSYPPPEGYRSGDGGHILNLNVWCSQATDCPNVGPQTIFGLAHEIGHVLGLYHSHQRVDRDEYVSVDTSLVTFGFEGNYLIASDSQAWPGHEMDFISIMSYPLCVFSVCGNNCDDNLTNIANCAPITLLPPHDSQWSALACTTDCLTCPATENAGDRCLGQRNHLSEYDKLLMSFLYPQANWRFVERDYGGRLETGVFHYPFRNFTSGAADIPSDGTLWIQPGTYSAVGIYNKAMTVKAPLGNVTLRD